jgi:hypothetical protein
MSLHKSRLPCTSVCATCLRTPHASATVPKREDSIVRNKGKGRGSDRERSKGQPRVRGRLRWCVRTGSLVKTGVALQLRAGMSVRQKTPSTYKTFAALRSPCGMPCARGTCSFSQKRRSTALRPDPRHRPVMMTHRHRPVMMTPHHRPVMMTHRHRPVMMTHRHRPVIAL